MRRFFPLLCLSALSLACSTAEASDPRQVGVILPGLTGVPVIDAPDTVHGSLAFTAVINTFGSSSCTTPAGTTLHLASATATVTPFDLVATDDQACTRDFAAHPHPIALTFTALGPARIVVRGVAVGGTVPGQTLVTVTKDIFVVR